MQISLIKQQELFIKKDNINNYSAHPTLVSGTRYLSTIKTIRNQQYKQ